MDPLSIAAACVGLISGVSTISSKITDLVSSIKNTQVELVALESELGLLLRSLCMFHGSGLLEKTPQKTQEQLRIVLTDCLLVANEIDRVLTKSIPRNRRERLQWVLNDNEKKKFVRLRQSLASHGAAISLAITIAQGSVTNAIRSDTGSIRRNVAQISSMNQRLADLHRVLEEMGARGNEVDPGIRQWLEEVRTYAESISDPSLPWATPVGSMDNISLVSEATIQPPRFSHDQDVEIRADPDSSDEDEFHDCTEPISSAVSEQQTRLPGRLDSNYTTQVMVSQINGSQKPAEVKPHEETAIISPVRSRALSAAAAAAAAFATTRVQTAALWQPCSPTLPSPRPGDMPANSGIRQSSPSRQPRLRHQLSGRSLRSSSARRTSITEQTIRAPTSRRTSMDERTFRAPSPQPPAHSPPETPATQDRGRTQETPNRRGGLFGRRNVTPRPVNVPSSAATMALTTMALKGMSPWRPAPSKGGFRSMSPEPATPSKSAVRGMSPRPTTPFRSAAATILRSMSPGRPTASNYAAAPALRSMSPGQPNHSKGALRSMSPRPTTPFRSAAATALRSTAPRPTTPSTSAAAILLAQEMWRDQEQQRQREASRSFGTTTRTSRNASPARGQARRSSNNSDGIMFDRNGKLVSVHNRKNSGSAFGPPLNKTLTA